MLGGKDKTGDKSSTRGEINQWRGELDGAKGKETKSRTDEEEEKKAWGGRRMERVRQRRRTEKAKKAALPEGFPVELAGCGQVGASRGKPATKSQWEGWRMEDGWAEVAFFSVCF